MLHVIDSHRPLHLSNIFYQHPFSTAYITDGKKSFSPSQEELPEEGFAIVVWSDTEGEEQRRDLVGVMELMQYEPEEEDSDSDDDDDEEEEEAERERERERRGSGEEGEDGDASPSSKRRRGSQSVRFSHFLPWNPKGRANLGIAPLHSQNQCPKFNVGGIAPDSINTTYKELIAVNQ
ncbi:hypothetical protein P7C70_g3462, partial [Phenoliferia sp. Uapishka_3]